LPEMLGNDPREVAINRVNFRISGSRVGTSRPCVDAPLFSQAQRIYERQGLREEVVNSTPSSSAICHRIGHPVLLVAAEAGQRD
jgi:hypothetical protein